MECDGDGTGRFIMTSNWRNKCIASYILYSLTYLRKDMPEEIESYLLIGGIKDGEWFNIPSNRREYRFPVYSFHPLGAKDVADSFGYQDVREAVYIKVCINRSRKTPRKDLYVFLLKELYDMNYYDSDVIYDVICKLVNNYKVIK